jgi:hypothetical protein
LSVEPGLDELDRGEPAVRAVRPVDVVVDPPVLEDHLGFEQGVEALAVEELVTEAPVERLDPGVLPRAARIDEHGVGAVEATPVGHRICDELGPMIEAHEGRGTAFCGQAFEAGHHAVCVDGTLDVDSQALAAVLVDDVQEFEVSPVAGLVEGEVDAHTTLGLIGQKAPRATPMPRSGRLRLR